MQASTQPPVAATDRPPSGRGRVRVVLAALAALPALSAAQAPALELPPPTRGQLLYQTHCVACHNSQMHWRDNSVVHDWEALVAQVRNWQATQKLQWSQADILEVARHLDATIYRLPRAGVQQGRARPAAAPG